jgi:hypothetical protein
MRGRIDFFSSSLLTIIALQHESKQTKTKASMISGRHGDSVLILILRMDIIRIYTLQSRQNPIETCKCFGANVHKLAP